MKSNNSRSTNDEFIEALIEKAQELADEHRPEGFWAKHFVSDWLETPNAKTHGLPPRMIIGLDGGRTLATGAMTQALQQKFSVHGQQL